MKEIFVVFWEGKNCGYIDGRCFISRKNAEQYAMLALRKDIQPKYNHYTINQLRLDNTL